MNEYAPRADKLPPLDVAEQIANISDIMIAVREQVGPSGEWLSNNLVHIEGQPDSELRANDHGSRFTNADDFWENGMDPSQAIRRKTNLIHLKNCRVNLLIIFGSTFFRMKCLRMTCWGQRS